MEAADMASLNDQQSARDAESYDDDRADGMYSAGGRRAHWYAEPRDEAPAVDHLDPSARAALNAAMAQIERALAPKAQERRAA